MRRILINRARDLVRIKRGGDGRRIDLNDVRSTADTLENDLLDLDDALTELGAVNPQSAEVAKPRFLLASPMTRPLRFSTCHATVWIESEHALARIAGVRVPSDLSTLRWSDIEWDRNRLRIRNVKVKIEGTTGRPYRQSPLYPRLKRILRALWIEHKGESEYVIPKCRDRETNLRTYLLRIIKKAGLRTWPKLFMNLHSTRTAIPAGLFNRTNFPEYFDFEEFRIGPQYTPQETNNAEIVGEFDKDDEKGVDEGVVEISDELARIVFGWEQLADPIRQAINTLSATTVHKARPSIPQGAELVEKLSAAF